MIIALAGIAKGLAVYYYYLDRFYIVAMQHTYTHYNIYLPYICITSDYIIVYITSDDII